MRCPCMWKSGLRRLRITFSNRCFVFGKPKSCFFFLFTEPKMSKRRESKRKNNIKASVKQDEVYCICSVMLNAAGYPLLRVLFPQGEPGQPGQPGKEGKRVSKQRQSISFVARLMVGVTERPWPGEAAAE